MNTFNRLSKHPQAFSFERVSDLEKLYDAQAAESTFLAEIPSKIFTPEPARAWDLATERNLHVVDLPNPPICKESLLFNATVSSHSIPLNEQAPEEQYTASLPGIKEKRELDWVEEAIIGRMEYDLLVNNLLYAKAAIPLLLAASCANFVLGVCTKGTVIGALSALAGIYSTKNHVTVFFPVGAGISQERAREIVNDVMDQRHSAIALFIQIIIVGAFLGCGKLVEGGKLPLTMVIPDWATPSFGFLLGIVGTSTALSVQVLVDCIEEIGKPWETIARFREEPELLDIDREAVERQLIAEEQELVEAASSIPGAFGLRTLSNNL